MNVVCVWHCNIWWVIVCCFMFVDSSVSVSIHISGQVFGGYVGYLVMAVQVISLSELSAS